MVPMSTGILVDLVKDCDLSCLSYLGMYTCVGFPLSHHMEFQPSVFFRGSGTAYGPSRPQCNHRCQQEDVATDSWLLEPFALALHRSSAPLPPGGGTDPRQGTRI